MAVEVINPSIFSSMATVEKSPIMLETLPMRETSRLEALIGSVNAPLRPKSRDNDHVSRNALASGLTTDEMKADEFNFDFGLPNAPTRSPYTSTLQDVFAEVQYKTHHNNTQNFAQQGTRVDCLEVSVNNHMELLNLYDAGLRKCFDSQRCEPVLRVVYVPLISTKGTSFGGQSSLSRESADDLFRICEIDPAFLLNLLGRQDYWSRSTRFSRLKDDTITSCELSLQHPRWNLQMQGSPTSVYFKYDRKQRSTTYIISHKPNDTVVGALRRLLATALQPGEDQNNDWLVNNPLDIHVTLSRLSFEGAKHHVKVFQRFMWAQFEKVDDLFDGAAIRDRDKLDLLTKQLQIISYNADSNIVNATEAAIAAGSMKEMFRTLRKILGEDDQSTPMEREQRVWYQQHTEDAIDYIVASMEKQKMWFLNYKSRKDSTMGLVFNLVTQQDALNNMTIAADMRKDSGSMNSIAALTMFFLPGTFTATVLGAGIFSAIASSHVGIRVSSLWWLWVAITVPLTLVTMLSWYLYQRSRLAKDMNGPTRADKGSKGTDVTVTGTCVGSISRGSVGRMTRQGCRLWKQKHRADEEMIEGADKRVILGIPKPAK